MNLGSSQLAVVSSKLFGGVTRFPVEHCLKDRWFSSGQGWLKEGQRKRRGQAPVRSIHACRGGGRGRDGASPPRARLRARAVIHRRARRSPASTASSRTRVSMPGHASGSSGEESGLGKSRQNKVIANRCILIRICVVIQHPPPPIRPCPSLWKHSFAASH